MPQRNGAWLIYPSLIRLQPVAYSTIIELDCKVNELEAGLPDCYKYRSPADIDPRKDALRCLRSFMIQLGICQERLRLHRPYQTRANVDETYRYSREVCIAASQRILEIHGSPLCEAAWAGLNYKVPRGTEGVEGPFMLNLLI